MEWSRHQSLGALHEWIYRRNNLYETIDRALSGLVFWRSGVNNGKQFLCASEWSTYLVCYKTSLIYKAPYLGVFQPIIHLESTRTYLMWFRSGTIDKAPLWCAWYWRNIFLVCQKSTVLPFCMLKIDVAPFLVCYRCG